VRPFAQAGSTILLLTTIAVGLILDNAAQLIWGPQTQALPNPLPLWHIRLGDGTITVLDLFILATGVGTALLLHPRVPCRSSPEGSRGEKGGVPLPGKRAWSSTMKLGFETWIFQMKEVPIREGEPPTGWSCWKTRIWS